MWTLSLPTSGSAGQTIKLHVRIEHAAGLRVVDRFFEERVGDAHDQRAVDLALGELEVDDQAAVLHGHHFVHRHQAGFDIDRDIGDLHAADAAAGQLGALRRRGACLAA